MNNYKVLKLPNNEILYINKQFILEKIETIKARDFRIFKNDIRSDISNIIFKHNCILIKFSIISAILFKNEVYFFIFDDKESLNFINFIKKYYFENKFKLKNITFELFIFESILFYLSNLTDLYLEKTFTYLSNLNINNFEINQLSEILKVQHSILIEKNKCQEYYESLIILVENNFIKYFNNNLIEDNKINQTLCIKNFEIDNKKTSIIDILNIYTNQIKEDIKNLDRLNNEINIFIDLTNVNLSKIRTNYAYKSLNINIINCAFSFSCIFTLIFGVNMKNGLEDSIIAFYILFGLTIIINIPIYFIFKKIFKLKE